VVAALGLAGCGRVGFVPIDDASYDAGVLDDSERLVNGDFSNDFQGWNVVRVSNGTVGEPYPAVHIWTLSPLSTGPCLLLDTPNDSDAYVQQTVTVPPGRRFRWTFETWGGRDAVSVTISYVDANDLETVLNLYDPPCHGDLGCTAPDTGTYEIAGYPGTQLTVRMRSTSPLGNRTWAYFDDVSLREF
jgi:hypothetical protein